MGTSFAQGGSGYPFFAPSVFEYFSGKDLCSISARREEIPDPEAEKTLQKACFAPLFIILDRYVLLAQMILN